MNLCRIVSFDYYHKLGWFSCVAQMIMLSVNENKTTRDTRVSCMWST